MGHCSRVYGFVSFRSGTNVQEQLERIRQYPFDEVFPFSDIFLGASAANYDCQVIGFAGAYKEVERYWNEWIWKFADLLRRLDAEEASVSLECVLKGSPFTWGLQPRILSDSRSADYTAPLAGQEWVISEAPENDFSIDPEWLAYIKKDQLTRDPDTGKLVPYEWTQLVPRVLR